MATTMKLDMVPVAVRSAETIVDLALKVEGDGTWQGSEPIVDSVGRSFRRLFDLLALGDQRMSVSEMRLFGALAAIDPIHDAFASADGETAGEETIGRVPDYIRAALEHDRLHGTSYGPIMVSALETLAHTISAAHGAVSQRERKLVSAFTANLRTMATVLT